MEAPNGIPKEPNRKQLNISGKKNQWGKGIRALRLGTRDPVCDLDPVGAWDQAQLLYHDNHTQNLIEVQEVNR